MATPTSVFLSTWRDAGVILYEINPRYHTREEGIVLGLCHRTSRYYHMPTHRQELLQDVRLWDTSSLEVWLNDLRVTDRSPTAVTDAPTTAPGDSWDPTAHPPIL